MQPTPPAVTQRQQAGAMPPVTPAPIVHTATSLAQSAPVQDPITAPSAGIGESQLKSILTQFKDEIKYELNN